MIYSARTRGAFAGVAIVAWAGELTFLVANAAAFGSLPRALWWNASFLTDWTGLLVAVVCSAAATGSHRLATPAWVAVATTAILLVGVMFGAMGGWAKLGPHSFTSLLSFSSLLAHVISPAAMLLVWLIVAPHGGLRWSDAPRFMLFPLAYLVAMFGRGTLGGGYPYPEVDVPHVGWGAALAFAGAVTLLFLLLGLLLVGLDRLLARRRR